MKRIFNVSSDRLEYIITYRDNYPYFYAMVPYQVYGTDIETFRRSEDRDLGASFKFQGKRYYSHKAYFNDQYHSDTIEQNIFNRFKNMCYDWKFNEENL